MEKDEKYAGRDFLSALVKAAYRQPVPSEGFEHKALLEVARHAIERSRRRARFILVASLSGVTTIAAASVAAVVLWLPNHILLSFNLNAVIDTVVTSIRALF